MQNVSLAHSCTKPGLGQELAQELYNVETPVLSHKSVAFTGIFHGEVGIRSEKEATEGRPGQEENENTDSLWHALSVWTHYVQRSNPGRFNYVNQ